MKGTEENVEAIVSRQAWQGKLIPAKPVAVTPGGIKALRGLPQHKSCLLDQPGMRIARAKTARNVEAHLQAIPDVESADSLEESRKISGNAVQWLIDQPMRVYA
jgi:hypothetical protein